MTQLKSTDLSQLDFTEIKNELQGFLEDQSEFTDYDFSGSGLSILLDVLAYNTHYNAYIANMLANEMFLDSAVKRSSAVSIAKHLGFTPASRRSARANVNITVNSPSGSPETVVINKNTSFSTTLEGNSYTFFNLDAHTIRPVGGTYSINGVELTEGTLVSQSFAVNNPGPDEKYELPDKDIDTSTLSVEVQTSSSNTSLESFVQTIDFTNVTSTSKVFFLQSNPVERYELFFGDGVMGKKLTNGNILRVNYLRSTGPVVNSSNTASVSFSTSTLGGSSNIDITTTVNPTGSINADTLSDIKFKAPRVNAAKNRAVTAQDYKALIEQNFAEAESVSVYGGENNVPPKFGKVMISLKPFDGFTISQATKDGILSSVLENKRVMAIQPEFIDPDFFFVGLDISIVFNPDLTTLTANNIKNLVTSTVNNYFSADLQRFDADFNKSKLIKNILESDTSIISVIITIKLQKRESLTLNAVNTFRGEDSFEFDNALQPGTLTTSNFFITSDNVATQVSISDIPDTNPPSNTGTGKLVLKNVSTNTILNNDLGNITYQTGIVNINEFTPTALPNTVSDFRVTASVQETAHNIKADRNQIIVRNKSTANESVGINEGLVISVSTTP